MPDRRSTPVADRRTRPSSIVSIFRNAGWLLGGKGAGALLSLIYLGMATRTLGETGFGQFMLILGMGQAIAAIATFQTWQIVVLYGMTHLRDGNRSRLDRLILFCSALDAASALAGGLLAALAVWLLAPAFGWSPELSRRALLFCLVLLFSLKSTPTGVLRLHDRFALAALADSMMPMMRLIGALAVIHRGASVEGFLAAWAVAEIVSAGCYWLFAATHADFPWRPGRWRSLAGVAGENPGLWRYSTATNLISSLGVSGKQIAVLLVGLFVSPAAAGAYRLCYQLAQALTKASQMMSRALFPELVRAHTGTEGVELSRIFRQTTLLSALVGGIILIAVVTIGKPMLGLIAGPAYVDSYPLLVLIGTAAVLDLVGVGFEPALFSTGRAGLAFRLRAISTLLLLGLMLTLLPFYGAIGAGVAGVIASTIAFVLLGRAAWSAAARAADPEKSALLIAAAGDTE